MGIWTWLREMFADPEVRRANGVLRRYAVVLGDTAVALYASGPPPPPTSLAA